jgi:hypothetical protein
VANHVVNGTHNSGGKKAEQKQIMERRDPEDKNLAKFNGAPCKKPDK